MSRFRCFCVDGAKFEEYAVNFGCLWGRRVDPRYSIEAVTKDGGSMLKMTRLRIYLTFGSISPDFKDVAHGHVAEALKR